MCVYIYIHTEHSIYIYIYIYMYVYRDIYIYICIFICLFNIHIDMVHTYIYNPMAAGHTQRSEHSRVVLALAVHRTPGFHWAEFVVRGFRV